MNWLNIGKRYLPRALRMQPAAVPVFNLMLSCSLRPLCLCGKLIRITAACRVPSVAECSIMPDHLHLAVKASPEQSPREVAEFFQLATARAVQVLGLWKDTFYVGTFGEYGLKYVRR